MDFITEAYKDKKIIFTTYILHCNFFAQNALQYLFGIVIS
jgi:hypothetical protein